MFKKAMEGMKPHKKSGAGYKSKRQKRQAILANKAMNDGRDVEL